MGIEKNQQFEVRALSTFAGSKSWSSNSCLPIFLPKARPKAPVNPIEAENCGLLLVQFAYFGPHFSLVIQELKCCNI